MYQEALTLRKAIAAAHPELTRYQEFLGWSYARQNKYERALAAYEGAVAVRVKLVAGHPKFAVFQSDLAVTYSNLAQLYGTMGRHENALTTYDECLTLLEKFRHDVPDEKFLRERL